MSGFQYVKLKDCCDVIGGSTPRRNIPEYWGKEIPWVTPKDISSLKSPFLNDAPEYISKKGYESCSTYIVPKNSILLTTRAPIGNVAISGREMCTNQGFKSLVPRDGVDFYYLYYCIKHSSPKLQALGNGATFKEISKRIVEDFEIPLPPLEEQKRIAAILDKADVVRRKRQQAIELSEQLLRSIFLDTFGDPVANPKGWDVVPLSKIVASLEGGKNVKPEDSKVITKNRVLKVSAVTSGVFKYNESKPLPNEFEPPKSFFVNMGDLLISRANTSELIGATAFVHDTPNNIVLPDKIWRIKWKNIDDIDPLYVHFLLSQPSIRREISNRASGTSGSMKNIPKPKLLEIKIPLPPAAEQKKFGEIVSAIYKVNNHFQNSKATFEKLFNSLTQQAFNGDLIKKIYVELA